MPRSNKSLQRTLYARDRIMTASKYLELARIANSIPFDARKSVRVSNAAVDEMRAIITGAAESGASALAEYYPLLSISDSNNWLAHQLIEIRKSPKEIEARCFAIVGERAQKSGVNQLGEKYWSQEWKPKRGRADIRVELQHREG